MSNSILLINDINKMQSLCIDYKKKSFTIGFVPTMGYLHKGHLSLVKKSKRDNQITIVSIFVNPIQFGQNEDFDSYPRDLNRDLSLLSKYNIDALFCPNYNDMLPPDFKSYIDIQELSNLYCGKIRPGHFKGVATIVNKFINIINPDNIYMGEKDFQQVFVLETMIKDLNMSAKIIRCPIIRENDGLAMSSRNVYLSESERENALCLYKSLLLAKTMIRNGETETKIIIDKIKKYVDMFGILDYIVFVNDKTFVEQQKISRNTRALIAVKIGTTRLIDNMRMN